MEISQESSPGGKGGDLAVLVKAEAKVRSELGGQDQSQNAQRLNSEPET